jgi:hypothetical protein
MSEENQIIDAEEVVEPAKVVLDDIEYMVADMDQQNQYLFAQVKDLEKKKNEADVSIFQAQFAADQIIAAAQAFQNQLAERLRNPEPVETEAEAPVANT